MRIFREPLPKHLSAGGLCAAEIFIFLLPFMQWLQFKIVGILFASDLLFTAAFVCLLAMGRLRLPTLQSKLFIVFSSLWLASQIVTDLMRQTAPEDLGRGWSRILLTIINFSVLTTLLYGRPRRLLVYGAGLAAGSLGAFLVNPVYQAEEYPWKFGVSYSITLAVFLLASRRNCVGRRAILISISIGLLNICLGARSRGGACLVVAACLTAGAIWRRKGGAAIRFSLRRLVTALTAVGMGAAMTVGAYEYSAKTGILGEKAKAEYEQQSAGRFGVLLGGRSASLGSLPAIYDSPILGHGSWAKDPYYVILQVEALAALGYSNMGSVLNEELQAGYIPAHSYILGSWVEAGVLGALFWGWVLIVVVKALGQFAPARFTFGPVATFMAVALAWDALFAPYGADTRFVAPYSIVMLMTCMVPISSAPLFSNGYSGKAPNSPAGGDARCVEA